MNRIILAVLMTFSVALPVSAEKRSETPPSKTAMKKVDITLYSVANKTITIHVDRMVNGSFRYSAWNKPKNTSEKPDLVIENSEVEKQGSQNGYNFQFKNGKWKYIVEDNPLGDSVSGGIILRVLKDDEEKIYNQMVNLKADPRTIEISNSKIYASNENMVIKIDQMTNGDMRYRAWNKPKKITDMPDVVANYGQIQYAPKSDGYIYSFHGKKVSYIIREKDEINDIKLRIIKDGEKEEHINLKDLFSVPEDKKGLARFDPLSESFDGWLMAGTKESQILEKLGSPEKISKGSQMEATGTFVQDWDYPSKGIFISMESPKASDKRNVSGVTLKKQAKLTLKKGIGIGSSRKDVFAVYGKYIDKSTHADNQMIAGDIYEGVFFTFTNEKVSEIYIGAGAE